jgi:hypothetical protein
MRVNFYEIIDVNGKQIAELSATDVRFIERGRGLPAQYFQWLPRGGVWRGRSARGAESAGRLEHSEGGVKLSFPQGVRFNLLGRAFACFRCAACLKVFKPGDTATLGADGEFPFRWLHKECHERHS